MKIAFTVCNRHLLSHALVLAHSLKQHDPGHLFFLGWVDRMKLPNLPAWVNVVSVDSLEITDWAGMQQRYYHFELLAACKPFFARHLLNTFADCKELSYFSPTTRLFSPIDSVSDKSAFLQLSPQRLRPVSKPVSGLDDKRILNTGMYQAASWIMHPDGQETALLSWWCERMIDRGFLDLCEGMCLDQLWLNYLPIYHEGVKIIQNAGWNYGLSAVPDSVLGLASGRYFVDEHPLITLDFAGVESHHPILSNHASLVKGQDLWSDLRQSYQKVLKQHPCPGDETVAPYGKATPMKSNRRFRKQTVRVLEKIIERIETLAWTYQ